LSPTYVLRRLASALMVIFLVLTAIFFVSQLLGDPVQLVLGDHGSVEQIAAVRARLHLDDPLLVQYGRFVAGAVQGDFGESFWQQQPALGLVFDRLPASLLLAVATMSVVVPVALVAGTLAACKPGTWIEKTVNVLSIVGSSIVSFWLALMLILIFGVTLRWLPTSGYGAVNLILPTLTLAVLQVGTLSQVVRTTVAEQLNQGYVWAARARGIRESRVLWRYAIRNALIPIFTVASGSFIVLVNGALIAEVVFGWPGVGLLLLQAISEGDLPLIQAVIFVSASIIVLLTLAVDMVYTRVNPRVRVG
jgi:peptide/nickel transport system permease protein